MAAESGPDMHSYKQLYQMYDELKAEYEDYLRERGANFN